jgi:hypothetical protein
MTQPTDLEQLIVANPGVDRVRLDRVRTLLAELIAKGWVKRPEYRLMEPFAMRPVRPMEPDERIFRRRLRQGL